MTPAWLRHTLAGGTVAALLAMGAPGFADTTPIAISPSATWKQDDAKFQMPPAIDGFTREGLVDYGSQRLDVSGAYQDRANGTTATLYLYRAPIPDVAMWHDRSLASIQPHSELGAPDRTAAVTAAFAPRGPGNPASGLRTVMPVSGPFVSTGLAVFQLREWLVAVRMSSRTLAPAQLTARMDSFVAALSYDPAEISQAPVAPMADCAAALRFKSAKRASPPDLGATLLLSTLGSLADQKAEDGKDAPPPAPRATFCRDASSTPEFGVYRADGSADAYVIALGDDGLSINVGRQDAVALLGGKGAKDYWVDLSTIYETSTYRGFRELPPPDKVLDVVRNEAPVSRVERDGSGNATVNLNSSVLK